MRKTHLKNAIFLSGFWLLFSNPAIAGDITDASFHIRQERQNANGVLVSRPNRMDEYIQNFLNHNNIRELADYSHWTTENLSYQSETTDSWATPKEMIERKKGDCEDFAFLNSAVLRVLGYQPHILALTYGPHQAHAICAFKFQDRYLWFDNKKLVETRTATLKDLAAELLTTTGSHQLLELDPSTQKWQLVRERS